MLLNKLKSFFVVGITLMIVFIYPNTSWAIPSFARQTNLPCSSCHTIFPELTPFGRLFKLNGYTMVGIGTVQVRDTNDVVSLNLLSISPLSAMIQATYTYKTHKEPGTQNDIVAFPQELSLFLGGQIAPRIGAFVQLTYDGPEGSFGIDNMDLRYANQTELASKSLIYGVSLNNNPSIQDVWNSTPAWGYPYSSSSATVSPMTTTLIEDGLGQNVAGIGAYGLWNNLIYGEVSVYRSAQQGGPQPPDNTATGIIKSLAPYWRVALEKQFSDQYVELGTFGMSTKMYTAGVTGLTDTFNDMGVDLNYERPFGSNEFTFHTTYIHEKRKLDGTFDAGGSSSNSLNLNTFKAVGNYYLHQQIGFSLGYFATSGDGDAVLYAPAAVEGSAVGKPDSKGIIAEFDYLPWYNTKFSVQYVAYNKFNGASDNYDGSGRNASDNNSVFVSSWIAF
ncbi:MAG: hypothetical protein WB996_00860 [Ignavibacteriaceae bacterium]